MLVPTNKEVFYSHPDRTLLLQGDVISATAFPLEDCTVLSPSFWMIITKSCDLELSENYITRHQNISVLPLFSYTSWQSFFSNKLSNSLFNIQKRIVFLAIWKLTSFIKKTSSVDNLLKNNISKFMFLPPDGTIFEEPMIIDFDMVVFYDGGDKELVEMVIGSKVLQLTSPFRERVAQRFASHYSEIGIDDKEIRDRQYAKELKSLVKKNSGNHS